MNTQKGLLWVLKANRPTTQMCAREDRFSSSLTIQLILMTALGVRLICKILGVYPVDLVC